jgi:hypothetical protein
LDTENAAGLVCTIVAKHESEDAKQEAKKMEEAISQK